MHIAAAAGSLNSCRYLLAYAVEVTSAGHVGLFPLHLAVAYGHLDVIKALVDNDAHPEANNRHVLNVIFEVLLSPFISDPAFQATIIIYILQQSISWSMSTAKITRATRFLDSFGRITRVV